MSLVVVYAHPSQAALDNLSMGQLLDALRAHSPQIASILEGSVRDRTPVRTGALAEDETSKAYTGGGLSGNRGAKLVDLYCNTDYQEAEWHRVYLPYQEGPSLGLPTYTNAPHEMYARVATDDLGLIEGWATDAIESAVNNLALGGDIIERFG